MYHTMDALNREATGSLHLSYLERDSVQDVAPALRHEDNRAKREHLNRVARVREAKNLCKYGELVSW